MYDRSEFRYNIYYRMALCNNCYSRTTLTKPCNSTKIGAQFPVLTCKTHRNMKLAIVVSVIALDCAQHSSRIAPLHGNRDPLEEELEETWLLSFCLEAVSQFTEELQSLWATNTCSFYGHWNKVVTCFQLSVLQLLPLFCMSCYCTCFSRCRDKLHPTPGPCQT